jgi:hypothetical protein
MKIAREEYGRVSRANFQMHYTVNVNVSHSNVVVAVPPAFAQ